MRGDAFTRQLRLLQLLESRPQGIAPDEASAELGTGRRTVYRDFRVLEDAGIPLTTEMDGRRARWRMMPGFRHRLQLSLTWSEMLALSTGSRLMEGLAGTLFHEGAISALEKIRATLPRALADRVRAAEARMSTTHGGRDYLLRGKLLHSLVQAIEQQRRVLARYRSRTGGSTARGPRTLEPLHLRIADHGIYLLARCDRSGELRTFLLDRFDSVELSDSRFEPPPEFHAERHLAPAFAMWGGRPRRIRLTVAPALADLLHERKLHPSQVLQRRSDGSADVRLEVAVGPPLIAWLCSLGSGLLAVRPLDVRRAVEREHRRALEALAAPRSRSSRDA